MCCSAAYAIAAGASYIASSPDATVGSIGTILPLLDVSGLWEAMGVKPDYITNKEGTLKTAGYPPSQSDEERASLQAETQEYFELFKNHVLVHREISKEDMRGQAFVGKSALKAGLIDEVCDRNSAYKKLCFLTRR
jgi:ClpP class serine protease